MLPDALTAIVLTLAVFRATRLVGWDDLPPVARLRAWVTGERIHYNSTEGGEVYRYDRPLLAHFIACPFCIGAWLSLVAYLAWLFEPRWTLYVLAPFALSAAVGLIAKQWDP